MGEREEAFLRNAPHTDLRPQDVAAKLDEIEQQLTDAWPQFPPVGTEFFSYLGSRLADGVDLAQALDHRHHGDLYLAYQTLEGNAKALEVFGPLCSQAVEVAVRRIQASDQFVDEVTQLVRMKLLLTDDRGLTRLANYRGAGRLRSWIQVVAVRVALDQLRRQPKRAEVSDDALLQVADLGDDPELSHIKDLYGEEFRVSFHKALESLTARERNMLRLVLIDGLSLTEVGRLYRIHRSTASRQLVAAREKLMDKTRSILKETMELSSEQFMSLLETLRSHLDLSLERVL